MLQSAQKSARNVLEFIDILKEIYITLKSHGESMLSLFHYVFDISAKNNVHFYETCPRLREGKNENYLRKNFNNIRAHFYDITVKCFHSKEA